MRGIHANLHNFVLCVQYSLNLHTILCSFHCVFLLSFWFIWIILSLRLHSAKSRMPWSKSVLSQSVWLLSTPLRWVRHAIGLLSLYTQLYGVRAGPDRLRSRQSKIFRRRSFERTFFLFATSLAHTDRPSRKAVHTFSGHFALQNEILSKNWGKLCIKVCKK